MEEKREINRRKKNPSEHANIISYLCFYWILPLFRKGRKKTLDTDDLYEPLKVHRSDFLGERLMNAWTKNLKKCEQNNKKPSLIRVTLSIFGWEIFLAGLILSFIEFAIKCPQPIFLGNLVRYYSNNVGNESGDVNEAYLYAGVFLLTIALNVLCVHSFGLTQLHIGMKLRVAMCGMIYRKSLRLSKNALGDTTAGQVVNLLSNDVGRFELSILFLHYLWLGPIQTILITYLMYREIGVAAIFGSAFLMSFIPLQGYLGKKMSQLRLKTALRTDERIRLMNEIIQGIKAIKMYAWEVPFGKLVANVRLKEIKVIRYVSYIRGMLLSFIMFTTRSSIFISLVGFVLLGNIVTAEKAFIITSYYNILRHSMTVFFSHGIGLIAETIVSIDRIQNYMMYNERASSTSNTMSDKHNENETNEEKNIHHEDDDDDDDNDDKNVLLKNGHHLLSKVGVSISNINAKWNEDNTELTLNNVNLHIQPGTLVAIIGPVGSGKSSLLQAILGELPIQYGKIQLNGNISYASQDLWIFAGTIRMNILFGQPMNNERYRQVIKTCALERDFQLFPNGDKTIVGERGQSLSGGQKARISLARACYRKASIYLLDDPLSAVDTHVGRHLFNQCISQFLQNNIVILVTHQLQYLQDADQIVIFNHGRIEAVGSYDSLRQSGLDFAKLLEDNDGGGGGGGGGGRDSPSLNRSISKMQRHNSTGSGSSDEFYNKTEIDDVNLKMDEKRSDTSIGFGLYKTYFTAGGGICYFYIMVLFCLIAQLLASGCDYFLTYWVNKEERQSDMEPNTKSDMNITIIDDNRSVFEVIREIIEQQSDKMIDIYIFTGITIATIFFTLTRSFLFFNLAMKASVYLHNIMYSGVTRATMYFFNTNPSGRILNRFSKDMGQIDEILPSVMIDVIQIFLSLAGIIVVVTIVNYWFLIPTIFMAVIFYYLRELYLKTSRNLKRIDATTRSPIYSHLGASLVGLSTIRAFGAEEMLIQDFDTIQDLNSSAFYLFISASRAFGFWLDSCCFIYIAIVTISFFFMSSSSSSVNSGNVGLAITQAMGMTGMVQWGMRQSAELENTMTAVERVVEYKTVDPEIDYTTSTTTKESLNNAQNLNDEWPLNGKIKFDKLSLRYVPEEIVDENILKNLTFEIESGEKIGIVGRTGAGKSSLINALFRLSYNTGAIYVDKINIQTIILSKLRKNISIIPQEPILFSGTMRYNLDPFDEYNDDKIWEALNEVKLKEVITELPYGLQSKISEGGSNFSVGQRQLVCLARAILRNNIILVMDEATANVDPQTDVLIQETIRNKFTKCTILTIAHRLNTVIDSDRILVLDAGRVVEFGTPYELIIKNKGPKIFHDMVKEMGQSTFESLKKIAQTLYEERKKK